MKKWNRTLFDWEDALRACGKETDVPVTDWKDHKEKLFHKIHGLRIFSLPESRRAVFDIHILRCSIKPTDQRGEIADRLVVAGGPQRQVRLTSGRGNYEDFVGLFTLFQGECFCDGALAFARSLYEILGVDQPTGFCLAHFTLTQMTFVKLDGAWVDYGTFLRAKNGLFACGERVEAQLESQWLSPQTPSLTT